VCIDKKTKPILAGDATIGNVSFFLKFLHSLPSYDATQLQRTQAKRQEHAAGVRIWSYFRRLFRSG